MAYYDTRTGHTLLGYFPTFGRYTMGAEPDYSIEAIASALLNEIGQIQFDLSKIGIGKFKLEKVVPDEIETVLNTVLSKALSQYVKSQLELSKDATAESVADVISSELVGKISPKLMSYLGIKTSDQINYPIFQATMDYFRKSVLKAGIKKALLKIGKAANAQPNPYAAGSTSFLPGSSSSFPIIPVAIGAAALLAVVLIMR